MRGGFPIATGTWYHVMSRDITPALSQNCPRKRLASGWRPITSSLIASDLLVIQAGGAAQEHASRTRCLGPAVSPCSLQVARSHVSAVATPGRPPEYTHSACSRDYLPQACNG